MAAEHLPEALLGGLSLRGLRSLDAADLPGFNKKVGHKAPLEHGAQAESQLREWGAPRIEALATRLHGGLRQALGLKRADIKVELSPAAIRMRCPLLEIRCWLEQDPAQASRARECVEVDHLGRADLLNNTGLLALFSECCDSLHWQPEGLLEVAALIDHLEAQSGQAKHLEYPLDAAWLRFTPPPGGVELYCDSRGYTFTRRDKESPFAAFVEKAISLFQLIYGLQPDKSRPIE